MTRSHCYAEIFQQYIKAGRKSIGSRELKKYAESEHDAIRLRAAENPKTPVECLEKLGKDKNSEIRIAIALNPNTPVDLKQKLAVDDDPTVRFAIAEDPHSGLKMLEMLADDSNPYVAQRAVKTLELLESASSRHEAKSRWYQTLLCPAQPMFSASASLS